MPPPGRWQLQRATATPLRALAHGRQGGCRDARHGGVLRCGLACVGAWYVAGLLQAFVPVQNPDHAHWASRRPGAQGSTRDAGRTALHAVVPDAPADVDPAEAKIALMTWLKQALGISGYFPKSSITYSTKKGQSVLGIPALQVGAEPVTFSTKVLLPPAPPPATAPAPPPAPEAAPAGGVLDVLMSGLGSPSPSPPPPAAEDEGDDAAKKGAADEKAARRKADQKARRDAIKVAERQLALEALQALPAMLLEMPDETFAVLQKQARKLANQTEDEPPAAAPKKRAGKGKKASQTAQEDETETTAEEGEQASAAPKKKTKKKKRQASKKKANETMEAKETETAEAPSAQEKQSSKQEASKTWTPRAQSNLNLTSKSLLTALDESETADFVIQREFLFASFRAMAGLPDRMPAHAQFLVPEGNKGLDEPLYSDFVVRFTRGEPVALTDVRTEAPRASGANAVNQITPFVDTYREQLVDADEPVTFSNTNLKDMVRSKTLASTILGLQASFAAENRTVKFTPRYQVSEDNGFKAFSLAVSVTVD